MNTKIFCDIADLPSIAKFNKKDIVKGLQGCDHGDHVEQDEDVHANIVIPIPFPKEPRRRTI